MEPNQPRSTDDSRASEEQPQWLFPDADPIAATAEPFVCDPYGGVPRREDYDPYNTARPPPPRAHDEDMQPTFRSFRSVVLSTQSWGAQWTDATDTSVRRWVQRALKANDVGDPSSPRAAPSGGPANDDSAREPQESPSYVESTSSQIEQPKRDSSTQQ
ncbi:hypothetical protein LSCM1_03182 [Leishmania martiniquensis]|uniref:Uncharacterized protein n=1 Tax=Leishmania martiniquensis TaxID=1580590 RepID=A0A836HCK9_9TRYP|nr:hypothetical protein LSCM1_03182 [Leishmania martiniquensis]